MRSYKQFHSKQLLDLVFAEKPAAPALVAVDGAAEFSELGGDWAVAGFLLWKREGICICWNKTRQCLSWIWWALEQEASFW